MLRRTIRLRLTVLCGGLFLVGGAVLLGITYALFARTTGKSLTSSSGDAGTSGGGPGTSGDPSPGGGSGPGGSVPPISTSRGGVSPGVPSARNLSEQALAVHQHAADLHLLFTQASIALGIMALISVALGWIVAGRILRPLRTITNAARDISATNLHRRLALEGPADELRELGDTFDDLLSRLEASFQAQRQFIANASHELRTPLARQRALGQVALADPDASVASLREAHERVLLCGEQQEELIGALLTLARGQAGLSVREPFDLARVVGQVVAARQPEARGRGLGLRDRLDPAPAVGSPPLAERLVANLVDNALRHNRPGGQVQVTTGSRAGRPVLTVVNTGPVVPESALGRLFQPFQRLGSERTGHGKGLGLGLSIVEAIATTHGATIDARPQPGGGLSISVTFPPADPSGDLARPAATTGGQPARGDLSPQAPAGRA